MRNTRILPSRYPEGVSLDTTDKKKIVGEFSDTNIPYVTPTSITVGNKLTIRNGFTRIIETEHLDDAVIVRGFLGYKDKVCLISVKIFALTDNRIYVYTVPSGVNALLDLLESHHRVSNLRDHIKDVVISNTCEDPDECKRLHNEFPSDAVSDIDNEGSSIYMVNEFNTTEMAKQIVSSLYHHSSPLGYGLAALDHAWPGPNLIARDIVENLTDDEILISGLSSVFKLTGAELMNRLEALADPYLPSINYNYHGSYPLQNPSMSNEQFKYYLSTYRSYGNNRKKQIEPIEKLSPDMIKWIQLIHRLVFAGRFAYTLPTGVVHTYETTFDTVIVSINEIRNAFELFKSAFAELIDFTKTDLVIITVNNDEEMFIEFNDGENHCLYLDLILISAVSLGLVTRRRTDV